MVRDAAAAVEDGLCLLGDEVESWRGAFRGGGSRATSLSTLFGFIFVKELPETGNAKSVLMVAEMRPFGGLSVFFQVKLQN